MLKKIDRYSDIFAKYLLAILMVAMTITVLLGVLFRYFLKMSFPWSEELARYLMIWIGFLGSSIALREGAHVGVKFFINAMPKKVSNYFIFVSRVLIIVFLLFIIKYGLSMAMRNIDQISPVMQLSMFIPYFAIPFSGILMLIYMVKSFKG